MFKPKLSLIAVACLSGVAIQNSYAQTTEPTRIVITAKGQQTEAELAAVSHIITADDIERSQANDLNEILQATSGISVSRNGGRGTSSSFFVRGNTSAQTVVLVDGVRIGSAALGSTELGHIPLEAIESIEVVKGPISGLYGADAMGGVVQIFTKKGSEDSSYASLELGSFGHQRLEGGFSQNGFNLSVSTEQNDGFDSTTSVAGSDGDDDSFEASSINLSGDIEINENNQLQVSFYNTSNEVEIDYQYSPLTNPVSENEINSLNGVLNTEYKGIDFTNRVGFITNKSVTEAYSSDIETERLSLSSQADLNLNDNSKLIAGFDFREEELVTEQSFSESKRDNTGLFVQYQLSSGKAGYVVNARYDDNSAYGSNTNGSLSANYAVNDSTSLTASVGTAFRAPNFYDLYGPFGGNADIKPEESTSAEIGIRGNTNGRQWRVSYFNTEIDNLIEYPAPNYAATNTESATLKGFELEYGARVANWYVKTSLDLLDATDEKTGKQLIRRPETTLKLSADRAFNKLNIGADLIAEQGRFDGSFAYAELDSWERVDVRGSYDVKPNFKVSAKINNLFDEDYALVNGFNTEGQAIQVSGKYSF